MYTSTGRAMGQRGGQAKLKLEGINVFVRVRPPGTQVEEGDSKQVVEVNESGTCVSVTNAEIPNKAVSCTFDRVFGPESTQEDVFRGLAPALETVLEGFNACVLAYGQTGSGKTHTLIGPGGGTSLPDNEAYWGIIPRAVQFLFDRLAAASEEDETFACSVTCSFLQIYNEKLVDLLQDGAGQHSASLQIREESGGTGGGGVSRRRRRKHCDSGGGDEGGERDIAGGRRAGTRPRGLHENRRVFVNGLSSFRVGGAQDVLRYVRLGAANRRVRATQHNEASSRSHAVMQLMVEAESSGGVRGGVDDGHVTYRQAKLSLVDLAGSEKMDSALTISKGHFNELRNINQSLSALGNVVSALSDKDRKHIPYRDSKLTRLLQDSLGGNTRTTIIACVNPHAGQTNETVNTLTFADRAKKVMVRLRPNEVVDDRVLLARAQAEIVRLKQLLRQALDHTLSTKGVGGSHDRPDTGGASREEIKPEVETPKTTSQIDVGQATQSSAKGGPPRTGELETPKLVDASETHGTPKPPLAQTRQIAKLIADNESLREDNDRLRVDIQRLVQGRRRLKRGRRGWRSVTPVRNAVPPASPIDWGARYADAAAQARRRRPASSRPSLRGGSASSPRARSVSPAVTPSVSTPLPAFRRREFQGGGDEEGEGAIENELSAEEIRGIVAAGVTLMSPGNHEGTEEVTQLEMFRCHFEGGHDGGRGQGAGEVMQNGTAGARNGVEPAEMEAFMHESQLLEDLMFEAHRREEQRLREERKRLRSARRERMKLEAQLIELNGSAATGGAAFAYGNPTVVADTTIPSPNIAPPPIATDGEKTSSDGTSPVVCAKSGSAEFESNNDQERGVGWVEPDAARYTGADTQAMLRPERDKRVKSSNPSNQEVATVPSNSVPPRVGPATEFPERRRRTQWVSPTPVRRNPHRQRPATSAGAAGRARSTRQRHRGGGPRSPTRDRAARFPAASMEEGNSSSQHRPRAGKRGATGSPTAMSPASVAKRKALQATYPHASSDVSQTPRGREQPSAALDVDYRTGTTTKSRLAYGVADLGLRLKVYSFRYDHFYECQVVGYDSRRRMHRCAYDATGEKQWHDLASKTFEVVGQNGVVIRSTESAPPRATSASAVLLPTSPSKALSTDGSER